MPAAVAVAKSKLGRKILKIGAVCAVGAGAALIVLLLATMTAMIGVILGLFTPPSGSVSTTGTVTISFSAMEPSESTAALSSIPSVQTSPSMVTFPILYAAATENGSCVMPWPLLAGVTNQESSFGRSQAAGVASGSNSAGAEGPFQFEPATFAEYANPAPSFPGAANPPSLYDAADAAFAAARKLCADGILTDPYYALWTYNAGMVGVSFQLVNGRYTPVYNDSVFAGSSDNPAVYAEDVLTNAALYGGGQTSGTSAVSVTGLSPGTGDLNLMQERSAMWMSEFASGVSCETTLQVPCFDAMPVVLQNYDGIALPSGPSAMRQALQPVSKAAPGDVILFGNYQTNKVKTKSGYQEQTSLVINPNTYAVVIRASKDSVALVSSNSVKIIHLGGAITEGMQIQGMTVQVVGSPF